MPEVNITPVAPAVAPTPAPNAAPQAPSAPPSGSNASPKGAATPNPSTPPKRIHSALAAMDKLAGAQTQPENNSEKSSNQSAETLKKSASNVEGVENSSPSEKSGQPETIPTVNPAETPSSETAKTKGESPWKLMDGYKKKAAELERKLSEMESGRVNEVDRKSFETKIADLEKRSTELQERLSFHDYTQHPDYQKQYVDPYNKAWEMGRESVQRFRVTDTNGNVRQATPQDFDMLMDLYARDPGQAAELIDSMFGAQSKFITPRLSEVDEALWKMRQAAQEFKTNGQKRLQEERETATRFAQERGAQVARLRAEADTALKGHAEHGKWLTPQLGDIGHNEALTKAQNRVTEALSFNLNDPKLTPEKLSEAVQKQTAVLNRAVAYGPLRRAYTSQAARIAELEKELEGFRNSAPKPGDGVTSPTKASLRGMDRANSMLEALARGGR